MQTKFNVVLVSIHTIQVHLPQMGDTILPAQQEIQLLNASIDTINYLRNTFAGTGVTVLINRISAHPYKTYNYEELVKPSSKIEEIKEPKHESPLEKVSNFELPSGKHKGKKLKDLDDDILKVILRTSKTQVVKSAIEAYLNLK